MHNPHADEDRARYPNIFRVLDQYSTPKGGWAEDNVYTILEAELRIRDSRIENLRAAISAALNSFSETHYGDREVRGEARVFLQKSLDL